MNWFKKVIGSSEDSGQWRIKLISDNSDWYSPWGGQLYQSDIVRAAIRPKVKAIGKLTALHVREGPELKINPEPYMRLLLEDPNPYSSGQMFREKMATQLALNNNAFALIYRDENGYPMQLYPINAAQVEAVRSDQNDLQLKFWLSRGKTMTVPYVDVLHLRDDYNDNDLFGTSKVEALQQVMEIINASDKSIVNAVKNSSVVRWILKFKASLKKEDRELQVQEFVDSYLSADASGGIVAQDPRYDVEEVKAGQQYVPSTPQQEKAIQRLYSFFGVNDKIVQAKYGEDDWNAYYESEIEPVAQQMSSEYTRKLFTRRERGFGNRIAFGGTDLSFASMSTKLALMQMVDRGAMTANEWRRVLNLPPIEGGDVAVRRLDMAPVDSKEGGGKGA
ncbi:phage portal protein [Virgibacillus siamensis]|uniref:phage portal protein n=1 Tax=Virgibacillus siamensis TaxID=480071 RepID=UPI00362F8077